MASLQQPFQELHISGLRHTTPFLGRVFGLSHSEVIYAKSFLRPSQYAARLLFV